MNFQPPGSPYTVSLLDGQKIVSVYNFSIGDPLVVLLHSCRTFSVIITFPEDTDNNSPNIVSSFLWLPLSEKGKMETELKKDRRLSWRFVCVDIVNGEECAFYRDYTRKKISVDAVTKTYFDRLNKKLEVC